MLEKCHLHCAVVDPYSPIEMGMDSRLAMFLENTGSTSTYYDYFPNVKPKTVYRISDIFLCRYLFFELPTVRERRIFVIGPYLYYDITRRQVMEQSERMGVSPKYHKQLEYFYASLPVVRDENCIYAMINTVAEDLWEEGMIEFVDVNLENNGALMQGRISPLEDGDAEKMNIEAMEKRYNYENELMDAVSRGNLHKAEQMITGFSSIAFENRVPDSVRNLKNYCIIMNTLFRKAAENGGVHPVYLDSVSSEFAKTIESMQTVGDISKLFPEIIRRYCRLVKRHSMKNYSLPVQKVMITIENDLTQDLSLKAMAEMNNVNPSYFSGLFKKETGQTLTDYVNQKRISYAKHLLKNTNLQVQTVAQHTGILDLHYFCRLFKNITGQTPGEYRKSLRFG